MNHMNSKNQNSIIVQPFSRWLSRIGFRSSHRCTTGIFIAFLLILLIVPVRSNLRADESSTGSVELVLTLDSAIELALERNSNLKHQRSVRETDRISLDIAEDRYSPEFSISSRGSYSRSDDTGNVTFGSSLRIPTGGDFALTAAESIAGDDPEGPTLTFSQPLLKGVGENSNDRVQLTAARLGEKKNILNFKKTVRGVVTSTITEYRALNSAFRNVEIAEASLLRARQQLDVSRALIQAGRIARREITRSEATVANRELELVIAQNELDAANYALIKRLDLESSTRIQPQENVDVDQIRRVEIEKIDVQESIATALRNRTDYLLAIMGVEEAENALREARNAELPDLRFTLSVKRDRKKSRNIHTAGIDLVIPLKERRGQKLATMKAENNLIKDQRNLEELRESIGIDIREAINNVEISFRRMDFASSARQLAQENLEIEQNKFSQGLSSTFEVSASEDGLVDAQRNENDAVNTYLKSLETLDEKMGKTLETWGIEVEEVPQ